MDLDGRRAGAAPKGRDTWRFLFWALVLVWHALFLIDPRHLANFGFAAYPRFIDSMALLAAAEAAQHGLDVYQPNPLDPFGRPHSYPSLWLLLGDVGLTRAANDWFAGAAIAASGFALTFAVRPRTAWQAFEAAAMACSPGIVLAVYRANNDLWIFAILSVAPWWIVAQSKVRQFGACVAIAFGAALKYYPAAAGVLVLAEPGASQRWRRLGIFALLLVLVALASWRDLQHFGATQPSVGRFLSFGGMLAFREAGLSAQIATRLVLLLGGGVLILAGYFGAKKREARGEQDAWWDPRFLFFVLGATLLCGCFWVGANWGYRWVFGLWLLPWFWETRGRSGDLLLRLVRGTWWLVMSFEFGYVATMRVAGGSATLASAAWWLSQALAWGWFGSLTWLLGGIVARRLRTSA